MAHNDGHRPTGDRPRTPVGGEVCLRPIAGCCMHLKVKDGTLVDVAQSEPPNDEFCELGWSVYAVMLLGSVATWVILDFLFGAGHSVAGAALTGMLGGLAMCAAVRWRARRGGRWRRSRVE